MQYFPKQNLRVVVTGICGFLGGHLGRELRAQGHYVVGADRRPSHDGAIPLEQSCDEFYLTDLRSKASCDALFSYPVETGERVHVFHLAGGTGDTHNDALVDMHMLHAARRGGADLFMYASSTEPSAGELCAEEACEQSYHDAAHMAIRVVRMPHVYGPHCAWRGGLERDAAAMCRKVAASRDGEALVALGSDETKAEAEAEAEEVLYVDDAVEGMLRAMAHHDDHATCIRVRLPGADRIAAPDLARLVMHVSGKSLVMAYEPGQLPRRPLAPLDSTVLRGWQPTTPVHRGIAATYAWVASQVGAQHPDTHADLRRRT
jgi:GDP-D-mannose 3',5'-epimerase